MDGPLQYRHKSDESMTCGSIRKLLHFEVKIPLMSLEINENFLHVFHCTAGILQVYRMSASDCYMNSNTNSLFRKTVPARTYNPLTTMGFSAMFTFQLDNTKK